MSSARPYDPKHPHEWVSVDDDKEIRARTKADSSIGGYLFKCSCGAIGKRIVGKRWYLRSTVQTIPIIPYPLNSRVYRAPEPVLDEETVRRLLKEGRELRRELEKRIAPMHVITLEQRFSKAK